MAGRIAELEKSLLSRTRRQHLENPSGQNK